MKAVNTKHPAPVLGISVLGPLQVAFKTDEESHSVYCAAASANLLACLAMHTPRLLSRNQLIALLYPDHEPAQGRRALTDALFRLNRELTEALVSARQKATEIKDWIVADIASIQLNLKNSQLDWAEFNQLTKSSRVEDWERALVLHRGELLDGLGDLNGEWLDKFREQHSQQHLLLLERTSTALSAAGRLADALALTRQWLLADPLREEAHCGLMRLYAPIARDGSR